ncbi:efflux transporter, outer membrane factor (OMF) lipoprotein, NodT family [Bryocella elongata]|uniref:Efflux transporter, outer membrane factor (OMF) lipoprotein, NodT family n=1 Tax=Bryocella elongata TaxID=863522 RepID=A0A1H5UMZ0_9BACT|nr:efflux transporter outer membrane subunit [Bryocella elongata]SEF76366.1 efflux transporter, outer membrane factor (OMF) lipoprotein, NodT family [Bryocella elongata]
MNVFPITSRLVTRVLLSTLTVLASSLLLEGCVVGPRYVAPVTQAPPAFKEAAPQQSSDGTTWIPATPQDATLRGNWWELYQEPELNALEEKLNTSNQSIAQSFQNFMAARAQVKQARAAYYPTVTVGPSYTRGRTSGNETSQATGVNANSNEFDLPFNVSWEPDVWGRIRNSVREYANAAQVSAADLANVRLSQQANLAQYYFELRGQDGLIGLYDKTVVAYQENLRLTQVRSRTGVDTEQSVAQAQLNLKNAIAARTNLRIARAQYEHAIALLTGQAASSFSMPVRPLTTSVPVIPIGVPSQLLQRRPDIAAAERTMAQANALIGVQTAAYYPTFNIGGDLGLESSRIGHLFTWPSRFFSLGPSASETLFDGGLRRGLVDQYKAQYEADAAAYRQTVLTAFQQTEDELAAERLLGQQRREQQEAIDAAQRYYDLSKIRYTTGVDTYLNVFTAEASLLSDQETGITLYVQQMTSSVQLIEALGGGWDTSQLPTEKSVSGK